MLLTPLDWGFIVASFLVSIGIGLAMSRRGGRSVADYFLTGRSLPWWLAGTSMVATTFAADTPLAVSGLVARDGIAGNWIWWSAASGSMLTVFFFARLWRRAGILTDVEFAELRYSGRPAALLRGFRAVYLGLPINCVIMGWVNLAMAKILAVTLGWDQLTAVMVSLAFTGVYASLAGLWGVVIADFVQFTFAMVGSVALAWFVLRLPEIGGLSGLAAALPEQTLAFTPRFGTVSATDAVTLVALPVATFLTYVTVQWWASWYPGQEPGGGGYVAQRMMSARDERHSLLATLWFTIAHYCLRPWPWVIVGLASLVLYPDLVDKEAGYVMVLRDHLPPGWRGLLLGAFFAAYMSTISTQLNWGTSYLVNDVYRRFLRTTEDERHYVTASRVVTLLLMVLSAIVTFYLESIRQAWEFVLESGAGIGLVLILRWYWWRVNAWSEIAAMAGAALGFTALKLFTTIVFPYTLLAVVAWTTVCWMVVTWLTPPESDDRLIAFYLKVRPDGPGWARIAALAGEPPPGSLRPLLLQWAAGTTLVYSTLFGTGTLLLRSAAEALPFLTIALIAGGWLLRDLHNRGWHTVVR
ncbi:MAG: sodium:solute symporter family protein [Vicinamibacterales bacterium]|nr:sodium:solute symporter family protein [Vicinamibacterales bacterium]